MLKFTCRIILHLVLGLLIFLNPPKILAQSDKYFLFANKILIIQTSQLEMSIEGGVINFIKDISSGEELVKTSAWVNRPYFSNGFMPSETSSVEFQKLNSNQGRLIYTISTRQLIFDINIDTTGEVLIQLTALGNGIPSSLDLPIINITQSSVILGSGAKYKRGDPPSNDSSNHSSFPSPIMAVVEGNNSVAAFWAETTSYPPHNINLNHQNSYDTLLLNTGRDPKESNSQKIVSPVWRIGTYKAWNKAAKRWRVKFEERTGAKPLWKNTSPWVRNIHAMFWGTNNYSRASQLVSELKDPGKLNIDPKKILFFLWNGDRIVLFGDHTLARVIGMPTPEVTNLLNANQMPIVLYHPWTLIHSDSGTSSRLSQLSAQGYLPPGYSFNPDYESTPQNWQNYWSDIKVNYFDGSSLYVLHPGSTKFQNYLVRNLGNYLATHKSQGAYMDILGMDHGFMFSTGKKVIDGHDYITGEVSAISNFLVHKPDFAIMSEYLSPWIMPFAFYTWQGAETYKSYYSSIKINHPLRVALTGSYSWTRESNEKNTDDTVSALLGGLPELSLVGNYQVSNEKAIWSQQRAKLFTDMELFNDIPEVWDPEALAYYRSKTGNWFKYKKIGASYAYVEELPNGSEFIRLVQGGNYIPIPVTPTPINFSKPGDANGDGRVDGLDYVIWVDNYGFINVSSPSQGDFNEDGRVDGLDYVIWVDNYSV